MEGAPFQAQTVPIATSTAPYTPGPSITTYQTQPPSQPSYKPILGSRKKDETNLKVVKATMTKLLNGKVKFNTEFVKLTESTANVPFISNAIKSIWGKKYKLVSNDGLEHQLFLSVTLSTLLYSIEFWKVGSRKVYAVPHVDDMNKNRSRKRAHHIAIDSDSDSDADFLPRKKSTCA